MLLVEVAFALLLVVVLVGEATEADEEAPAACSVAASASAVPARLSDTSAGVDHADDDANSAPEPLAWRGVENVNCGVRRRVRSVSNVNQK